MSSINLDDARRALRFREHAEIAFAFLLREFRFRLVASEDTFLQYENETVFVNVYHGRRSFELQFEIGLLARLESKYYPEEVASFYGAQGETFFQASTPDRVARYVPQLADLLESHCSRLLSGDAVEFENLQQMRQKMSADARKREHLTEVRERADRAWKQRDYPAVLQEYTAIEPDLTLSEQKKLLYAMKKLGRIQ